jgi:cell division protein FtsL
MWFVLLFVLLPVFVVALTVVTMQFVFRRLLWSHRSRRVKRHHADETMEADEEYD